MAGRLFAHLLQKCPYSHKMAKLLEPDQKKWVRRGSVSYHRLKEQYGLSTTFPIVLVNGKWIGGYNDFLRLKK